MLKETLYTSLAQYFRNFYCVVYANASRNTFLAHELATLRRLNVTRVIVQPFLNHGQVLVAPLCFFFDVFQGLFNYMFSTSKFPLSLNVKLLYHVVTFLSGENPRCGSNQVIPKVGFVCESVVKFNQLENQNQMFILILLDFYGVPVFL